LKKLLKKKLRDLEEEPKNEIKQPLNSPTEAVLKSATDTFTQSEPFIKENSIEEFKDSREIVAEINTFSSEPKEVQSPIDFEWDTNQETKEDKTVVKLQLEDETEATSDFKSTKTVLSPEEQQRLSQERLERIQQYTQKLKKPEGLISLENEPAYLRKNVKLDESKLSEEQNISRFGLTEDENGTTLKSNNKFLHDNVD
jgi:cell division protein FtsZ